MRVAMFEGYDDATRGVMRLARERHLESFEGIVTPGQMLDSAIVLNTEYSNLDQDIARSGVDSTFKAQWASFLTTWRSFFDSLQGASGYAKRLWAGTSDEIDSYRTRLVDWQRTFQARGGNVAGTIVRPPAAGFDLANWKWILIAGVGLYALVTFGPAISKSIGGGKR